MIIRLVDWLKKYITYIKRYHEVFPKLIIEKQTPVRGEYWSKWSLFSRRYVVFRWETDYGQGSLIPSLIESFMWADEQGMYPVALWRERIYLLQNMEAAFSFNEWDCFYKQDVNSVLNSKCVLVGALNEVYSSESVREQLYIKGKKDRGYMDLEDPDWREIFSKYTFYYNKFFALNDTFKKKVDREWNTIHHEGDRILAVVLREEFSIDREKLSQDDPLWVHPWCKRIEDILEYVKNIMTENDCSKLYISSSFSDTIQAFEGHFGKDFICCSTRKRIPFSEYEAIRMDAEFDSRLFSREDLQMDEGSHDAYMRDMIFASRCECMVGHQCSATRTALIFNGGKYGYYSMIPNHKQLNLAYRNGE